MNCHRFAFGSSLRARQPLSDPCRTGLCGRQMGEAGYEGCLFGTDHPQPGSLPLVSTGWLAADKPLPEASVPALETLRKHNPLAFDLVLKRRQHAGHRHSAASIFETRRFSDRKPA